MDDLLTRALQIVDRYNFVFYGVGLLGALLYLLRARAAYRQRRFTAFPIEREEAAAALRDALVILTILVAILATTYYIDHVLLAESVQVTQSPDGDATSASPTTAAASATATLPVIGLAPTPEGSTEASVTGTPEVSSVGTPEPSGTGTPEVSVTPLVEDATPTLPTDSTPAATASPQVATPTPEPSATAAATMPPTATRAPSPTVPTATPPPTNTALPPTAIPTQPPAPTAPPPPTAPPVPAASCPTAGVQISSPGNGQTVQGLVTVSGTANIPGFQFYKVEFGRGTNPGSFASIGDTVASAVNGGVLTTWQTGGLDSGVWALRLTVVDQSGNFPAPCQVYVVVP